MERIKQALERARKEREGVRKNNSTASLPAVNSDILSIKYTQTRAFDVSDLVLEKNRIISMLEPSEYSEAVKILRTQVLQRMEENDWSTLAITSPRENEGKTLTTINMGVSIALEVDYTVLLVDANLRNPSMHKYFDIEPIYGLSDYLMHDTPLSEILLTPSGIPHVVLLPGGRSLLNPSEMLGSPKMIAMVQELKSRYQRRKILFDLPPLLDSADVLSFSPCVDAALIVLEDDKTTETDLKSSLEMLSGVDIIGTVLNKANYYNY